MKTWKTPDRKKMKSQREASPFGLFNSQILENESKAFHKYQLLNLLLIMSTNLRNRICSALDFGKNTIGRFLIIVITLFVSIGASAQSIDQRISIKVQQVSLKDFFKEVEKQSSFTFVYRDIILNEKQDVSIDAANKPLNEILAQVLSPK